MALPTVSFTVNPVRTVTLYGSYTRGLEDSPIAPPSAVNRGEPPPATTTWQIDGGVRIVVQPHLQLLLGAFKVQKTYFGFEKSRQSTLCPRLHHNPHGEGREILDLNQRLTPGRCPSDSREWYRCLETAAASLFICRQGD